MVGISYQFDQKQIHVTRKLIPFFNPMGPSRKLIPFFNPIGPSPGVTWMTPNGDVGREGPMGLKKGINFLVTWICF